MRTTKELQMTIKKNIGLDDGELAEIAYDIFGDNDDEITQYYIETICGENMYMYDDNNKYDEKEIEAFRWGTEWLIEYMMMNDRLPERTGSKYSTDENFMAWLIKGYDDECEQLKSMMIQMNRNKALDELLA
jgi:hypothetical protein